MRERDTGHGRRLTLEAMVLLAWARLLVAHVPFARWRASLGKAIVPPLTGPPRHSDANLGARCLARAVERASARLPRRSQCLPQAMALQWMLRRRELGGILVIGVRARQDRGTLADLHAWIVRDGEILIGASNGSHHPLYAVRA